MKSIPKGTQEQMHIHTNSWNAVEAEGNFLQSKNIQ